MSNLRPHTAHQPPGLTNRGISAMTASVGYGDKLLLTWRVSDNHQVGEWKHYENLSSVAKLDRFHVIFGDCCGDCCGDVTVLKHNNGTAFHNTKRNTDQHSKMI